MFRISTRLTLPVLLLITGMVFLATINSGQAALNDTIRHISLPAKDLIFDSNTQKIYASVPSSVLGVGNSITRIDPVTGVAETSIQVGSDPGKLAISGDKQFLYVGLDGEAAVRRVVLATQTPSLRIPLGNSLFNGPHFVEDMEVIPGAPQSVVISRRRSNTTSARHEGVVVFDNDVQRPTTTNVNVGKTNFIEFLSSPATVYGFNSEDTGLQLFRLSVTPDGISIANQIPGFGEFGDFEGDGELLYHTAGRVINPETQTTVGTYTGMNFLPFINARSVVVDSANDRVYFLAGGAVDPDSNGTARLYAFNKTTFALIGTYSVSGIVGRIGSLVQWSADGLAFRDQNRIYLVPTPTGGPAPSPTPTPSPTATPTPTPAPGELREISLATNDLVYSTSTQSLYASVPSSAGPVGNSITLINPVAGSVGTSVIVGSEPNKLAISDDGQEIHVGLNGASAIRRFHVATNSAGLQFSVTGTVSDIAAMPGSPNIIAAASASLVRIYDNGIARSLAHDFGLGTHLAFSKSHEVLYGYDSNSSSFQFSNMVVGSCGVGLAKSIGSLISGNVSDIKHDNGRVYASNGRVIDPDNLTVAGTFFVPTFSALVEPDSKANRIYSLTTEGSSTTLRVFDMQTFTLIGALSIPGVTGTPLSLVRWGTDGLAFNTPTKVFLLQNPMIGVPAPFTPAPAPTPSSFTVRGTILQLNTPVDDVTITFSGSRNGITETGADGKFAIGDLPLCGSLTITPSKPNWIFTPSSITITNPNHTANFSAFHRIIGFVQTQVSVSESVSKVFLAIQRSAGLPPVTTDVDFSTTNGTASDRSDYTAGIGTFHFDAITAQAPIEVLLTDDVFVEGPETFTVTLEPVPGFDLVNPTVTVTIIDNDVTPPITNPVDTSVFFVRRHYHDFLNRDPDAPGLAFWVNEIENCAEDKQCRDVKRIHVSAAFFLSIEFQETGYLAYRMYKSAYGDSTSPNVNGPVPIIRFREFLKDAQRVGRGVQVGFGDWQAKLEENKVAYTREFVLRERFLTAFPLSMTPTQFVDKLDQNAGGVLSTTERNQLIAELTGATDQSQARASVVRKVAEDADLRQREFNRAFVLLQYYGYLRRNPDDPQDTDFQGWEFWLNKLNQSNGNFVESEMVKAFLLSTEYRQRFGPP